MELEIQHFLCPATNVYSSLVRTRVYVWCIHWPVVWTSTCAPSSANSFGNGSWTNPLEIMFRSHVCFCVFLLHESWHTFGLINPLRSVSLCVHIRVCAYVHLRGRDSPGDTVGGAPSILSSNASCNLKIVGIDPLHSAPSYTHRHIALSNWLGVFFRSIFLSN